MCPYRHINICKNKSVLHSSSFNIGNIYIAGNLPLSLPLWKRTVMGEIGILASLKFQLKEKKYLLFLIYTTFTFRSSRITLPFTQQIYLFAKKNKWN